MKKKKNKARKNKFIKSTHSKLKVSTVRNKVQASANVYMII
jgi:hypothetical protein